MMTFSLVLLIATHRGKKHGDDLQCFIIFTMALAFSIGMED